MTTDTDTFDYEFADLHEERIAKRKEDTKQKYQGYLAAQVNLAASELIGEASEDTLDDMRDKIAVAQLQFHDARKKQALSGEERRSVRRQFFTEYITGMEKAHARISISMEEDDLDEEERASAIEQIQQLENVIASAKEMRSQASQTPAETNGAAKKAARPRKAAAKKRAGRATPSKAKLAAVEDPDD